MMNEKTIWLELREVPSVKEVKLKLGIKEDTIMITYKGVLMTDKNIINGKIEPGDILDAQIKINHNQ